MAIFAVLISIVFADDDDTPAHIAHTDHHFTIPLTFNHSRQLFTLPLSLGLRYLSQPFHCSLDLHIPSILVPNTDCTTCSNDHRFTTPKSSDPDSIGPVTDETDISTQEMYMDYTHGKYKVRAEQMPLVMNYKNGFNLTEQILVKEFEFYSVL